eukprot:5589936-Amphidinium_carterae.1
MSAISSAGLSSSPRALALILCCSWWRPATKRHNKLFEHSLPEISVQLGQSSQKIAKAMFTSCIASRPFCPYGPQCNVRSNFPRQRTRLSWNDV